MKRHCCIVTKAPAAAVSSSLLTFAAFASDMMGYAQQLQASKQWGAVLDWLFWTTGGTSADDTGTGDTTGDTTEE